MQGYEKPIVLRAEEMAEGVYLASGSAASGSCYTAQAYIVQERDDGHYLIQVNAQHSADHMNYAQMLTITFNKPVEFINMPDGTLSYGDGTNTLKIALRYTQNPSDNIGFGSLEVSSEPGLAINSVTVTD